MQTKKEWYKDGLNFQCTQCGKCCTGPPGLVEFTPQEGQDMAEALGCSYEDFLQTYTEVFEGIPTLKETETVHGFDCIMLERDEAEAGGSTAGAEETEETEKAEKDHRPSVRCRVHAQRPAQCRCWPFWPETVRSESAWRHAGIRCHGIDQGQHFSSEEIHKILDSQEDHGDPIVPY